MLWDLKSFKFISSSSPEISPIKSFCWSNDSKKLFSSFNEGIRCYDVSNNDLTSVKYIEVGWTDVYETVTNSFNQVKIIVDVDSIINRLLVDHFVLAQFLFGL